MKQQKIIELGLKTAKAIKPQKNYKPVVKIYEYGIETMQVNYSEKDIKDFNAFYIDEKNNDEIGYITSYVGEKDVCELNPFFIQKLITNFSLMKYEKNPDYT